MSRKKRRCGWWEYEGVTNVGKRDGVRTDVGNKGVTDVGKGGRYGCRGKYGCYGVSEIKGLFEVKNTEALCMGVRNSGVAYVGRRGVTDVGNRGVTDAGKRGVTDVGNRRRCKCLERGRYGYQD